MLQFLLCDGGSYSHDVGKSGNGGSNRDSGGSYDKDSNGGSICGNDSCYVDSWYVNDIAVVLVVMVGHSIIGGWSDVFIAGGGR